MISPMLSRIWTDPVLFWGLARMVLTLFAVFFACRLLTRFNERLERRVPAYRRPLEAAYARFHLFLALVQLTALRRTR